MIHVGTKVDLCIGSGDDRGRREWVGKQGRSETARKTHGKRGKGRRIFREDTGRVEHYLPYGAKVVEGGYIYNGTL